MQDRPIVGEGDGCSGFMSWGWRRLFGKAPPWEGCCDEHDQPYREGGTATERQGADARLFRCVTAKGIYASVQHAEAGRPVKAAFVLAGYAIVGFLMWAAVRVGGHPMFPLPWRWGYGKKYPTPYREEA